MANPKKTFDDIFVRALEGIDVQQLLIDAMTKKQKRILDLNRANLDRGIDANGKSLGRYARFEYKHRYQPVDLLLKGPFRKRFTLGHHKREGFSEIFSQDWKEGILEARYGMDIHGIQRFQYEIVGSFILPQMQTDFKRVAKQKAS